MRFPELQPLSQELQNLQVENDSLRANIDALLSQLDATEFESKTLHARQLHLESSLAQAIWAERITSEDSRAAIYRSERQGELRNLRETALRDDAAALRKLATELEHSRLELARRSAWLSEELAAVQQTLSWRITQPLRRSRQLLNIILARVSHGRWGARGPRMLADPASISIPHPPLVPNEVPILDIDHYRRCYPSLDLIEDADLITHYVQFGQDERRSAISPLHRSHHVPGRPDDTRERTLFIALGKPSAEQNSVISAHIDKLSWKHHLVAVIHPSVDLSHTRVADRLTMVIVNDFDVMHDDDFRALAHELVHAENPSSAITMSDTTQVFSETLRMSGITIHDVDESYADEARETPPLPSSAVRESTSERHVAAPRFSFVATAAELANRRALARKRHDLDRDLILGRNEFDSNYFSDGRANDPRESASSYLRNLRFASPLSTPNGVLIPHRPRPGFHPLVYAEDAPDFIDDGRDPFAHFLAAGQPAGRWNRRLITPSRAAEPVNAISSAAQPQPQPLRVLVHGHFYYPELIEEFLDLLGANSYPMTLALTTDTHAKARKLDSIARMHPAGKHATVRIVPNQGRNLSALLSGTTSDLVRNHDLVLHIHGKRSPQSEANFGDSWRRHMWTHLLGDGVAFGDQIISEFIRSPRLGLIAPEDRRLHDWDKNREFVPHLLDRLQPQLSRDREFRIPTHFDFSLGAMFWARSTALAPFLDSGLRREDFPEEPLPIDGTSLHALERLIPLVVEHEGFEFAKTHIG